MKIYFDISHYKKEKRNHLVDFLRPFINIRSLEENIKLYGEQITEYEIVSEPRDADLHILTMTWGYYFETKQLEKANSFIQQAQSLHKPVAIWQNADFSLNIPSQNNVWLFQCGGHFSTRNIHQYGQPVFIGDPLKELNMTEISLREKSAEPIVGFCGQAEYTFSHALSTRLRFGLHNLKSKLKIIPYESLQFYLLPTKLRWQALDELEKNLKIKTNFIKRKKYRAGAQLLKDINATRQEFWKNMIESDYIVCIRGTGNFSARLYETLAMGRIPVFINTDCLLPYEESINWKDYCVWVEANDLVSLPQKLIEFHARMTNSDFIEHQKRCRQLWEERLSFPGFLKHFPEHFIAVLSR